MIEGSPKDRKPLQSSSTRFPERRSAYVVEDDQARSRIRRPGPIDNDISDVEDIKHATVNFIRDSSTVENISIFSSAVKIVVPCVANNGK